MTNNLSAALARALQGDADAISDISRANHRSIGEAAAVLGTPLLLKKAGVSSVLRGLIDGQFSPSKAQVWASFMRRGYVGGTVGAPIEPINIEFDAAWEQEMSDAISRLDEIGDAIDGVVSVDEAIKLLRLLREPSK